MTGAPFSSRLAPWSSPFREDGVFVHRTSPFNQPLHVGRPNVGDRGRLLERIEGALDRLWLTNNGPLVREFESEVAEVSGVRHCVATCNATNGLQIAARAAGVRPGDEVIMPSFTWVATAHAMEWIGAVPVFCDIDPETGTADPRLVEELITERTRAVLAVHVFGRPCDVEGLSKVASRHGLPLLFDAAHAFANTRGGVPIGGSGSAEVFSFHATKFVNTFEGGAVVTNDDDLAETARGMVQQGLDHERRVTGPGTVARMSEISAAMGLTSLEILDRLFEVNTRNHAFYAEGLEGVPGVTLRGGEPGERHNHQYVVAEIDPVAAGVHRDEVHDALHKHNVLSRRYFYPVCHQMEPYRSGLGRHVRQSLAHTEALTQRVLALPTGLAVGEEEIAGVCSLIRQTVGGADHV